MKWGSNVAPDAIHLLPTLLLYSQHFQQSHMFCNMLPLTRLLGLIRFGLLGSSRHIAFVGPWF